MSTKQPICSRAQQGGVSLIELMIALVVGLLLIAGLLQVYLSTKQSYVAQEQLARMQEGGRFAMDLITRDLRRAGYWGGNVDVSNVLTFAGDPGPAAPTDNTCIPNDDAWGRMVTWRVTGMDHTSNPAAGYSCAQGYIPNTDILVARYSGPDPVASVDASTPNRLYLRSTLFLGRVMTSATAGAADNILDDLVDPPPDHLLSSIRPLVSHGYYVGASNSACNGVAIPALNRIWLDEDGRVEVEEIALGVEQLQVRYLLNNVYVDANAVGTNWRDVTAVRVWLLMRGECPEPGLENTVTFAMGNTVWPQSVPDNFRRQLYTSTVMLRNTLVR